MSDEGPHSMCDKRHPDLGACDRLPHPTEPAHRTGKVHWLGDAAELRAMFASPPTKAEEKLKAIEQIVIDWGAGTVHRPTHPAYRKLLDVLELS